MSEHHLPKMAAGSMVRHPNHGLGRLISYEADKYVIQFRSGDVRTFDFDFDLIEEIEAFSDPDSERIKHAVREVLGDFGWIEADLEMGKRWQGGTMVLNPGTDSTQPKEIPLDGLFRKLVGIREKLRVLEQKVNNHPKLDDEDRMEMQAYITRCYGSLTTFNVLFADKASHIKGSGK